MCLQLDKEKLERIPILKTLRALEEQAGKDVTLGAAPAAAEPDVHSSQPRRQTRRRPKQNAQQGAEGESNREKRAQAEQPARQRPVRERKESRGDEGAGNERGKGRRGNMKDPEEGGSEVMSQCKLPVSVTTVYLGGIPAGLRVSELKSVLREKEAAPLRLTWQGAQHRAFLDYSDPQAAEHAIQALHQLTVSGSSLQAELAKSQRGDKKSGQSGRRTRPPAAPKSTSAPGNETESNETTEP